MLLQLVHEQYNDRNTTTRKSPIAIQANNSIQVMDHFFNRWFLLSRSGTSVCGDFHICFHELHQGLLFHKCGVNHFKIARRCSSSLSIVERHGVICFVDHVYAAILKHKRQVTTPRVVIFIGKQSLIPFTVNTALVMKLRSPRAGRGALDFVGVITIPASSLEFKARTASNVPTVYSIQTVNITFAIVGGN